MKTAILISGHMRSFERCLPTLHWHVFRHFTPKVVEGSSSTYNADPARGCVGWYAPGGGYIGREKPPFESTCDFFVSTEPDADAPKAELLRAKYPGSRVEIDLTPQPAASFLYQRAAVVEGRPFGIPSAADLNAAAAHAPYAISVPVEAVLGQLWRLQQCWSFVPMDTFKGYDLIIRCRPDLWMESFALPKFPNKRPVPVAMPDGPTLVIGRGMPDTIASTPWWGRFGGVNDRFAILGLGAAFRYFCTFENIPALLQAGCPLHPESLIKASLEAGGCTIDDTLDVSFSTLRPAAADHPAGFVRIADGCGRRFPEIMAADIAHFRR